VVDAYKIATLNANGVSAKIRMRMLAEFLRKEDIDIILLQEVTHNDFDLIWGYNANTDIGINKRGTAILTTN
jgi:exonuclease III